MANNEEKWSAYRKALVALERKVSSDEVQGPLQDAKIHGSPEAAILVDALEQGALFSGEALPPEQQKVVRDFLEKCAPKEFAAFEQARVAYVESANARTALFADRVKSAVGNSVDQPSQLAPFFANLGDDKAMELGGIIERATGELSPLIAARDDAQRGIDTQVTALQKDIVGKGLLSENHAQILATNVRKQLEARAAAQQDKTMAKSA